jgi:hypothetical protein
MRREIRPFSFKSLISSFHGASLFLIFKLLCAFIIISLGYAASAQALSTEENKNQPGDQETILEELQQPEISGPKAWLAVLVEYPDIGDPLPPISYFQGILFNNGSPSVDHWIREVTYNRTNFQGSQILGPYTLPKPWDGYNFDYDDNGWPEFVIPVFIDDIMSKVKLEVDITQFYGFFFMMNEGPADNKRNGPVQYSFTTGGEIDGQFYSYVLLSPGFGWNHQRIIAHETFHAYGIYHSSRPDFFTETPHWDNMGGDGTCDYGNPQDPLMHPLYGCRGIHTIAWHKLSVEWIDPARNYYTGIRSRAGIVNIERLELPPLAPGNYLMAELHVPGSDLFYTVEYRRQLGYDDVGAIPGEAVIIHDVDLSRTNIFGGPDFFAKVVDSDGNGDPNDEGAMWLPGETFLSGSGVIVHVESMNDKSAVVSVSNHARNPVYADDSNNSGFENGTITYPWNTLTEAYASVTPSGIVYMQPGTYSETMTISKPSQLMRQGSSGSVIIGQ